MKQPVYVCGHKNPDSDSIVCTVAYARLKALMGQDVKPIRIGRINNETDYILKRFSVEEPEFVSDIKPRVYDLAFDEAFTVKESDTVSQTWNVMRNNGERVIAVLDERERLVGMTTIFDISNALLASTVGDDLYVSDIPLENIAATLEGKLLFKPETYDTNGIIKIASSTSIGSEQVLFEKEIVVTSSRSSTHRYIIEHGAALLIVTQSEKVEEDVLQLAKKHSCGVIVTPYDLYHASNSVCGAMPVNYIMARDLVTFNYDDLLEEVRQTIIETRYRSYPIIDHDGHVRGFLSRHHLLTYDRKKIILVDHNETHQTVEGIEEASIQEIIDHHKVGDIQTMMPITFRNETVGACATIVAKLYYENNIEIPKDIAGILCGAIISDTLNFNSPTCTETDIMTAMALASKAEINIEEYAAEIMRISADLASKSISEIVSNDNKEFLIRGYRIVIAQINIYDPIYLKKIEQPLREYLDEYALKRQANIVVMMFTDINTKGSYLMLGGKDRHLLESGLKEQVVVRNQMNYIPGLLSRKQQVVPMISSIIEASKL